MYNKPPTSSDNRIKEDHKDGVSDNMPNIQSALHNGDDSSNEDGLIMGKTNPANEEGFYDGQDGDDQDDLDDDDDDDLIDDDMIDDEAAVVDKKAVDKAASFDSESASNASPLINQKKIRSLRHAATLATDGHDHQSQNFDTDAR